jgi:hypothetical protein
MAQDQNGIALDQLINFNAMLYDLKEHSIFLKYCNTNQIKVLKRGYLMKNFIPRNAA